MTTDTALLKRIRALIAKSEGTDSPAEAAVFMAKARELLDKHQLTTADLEDNSDPMGKADFLLPNDEMWMKLVCIVGSEWFDCAACFFILPEGRHGVTLWGREGARAITREMVPHLIRTVLRIAETDPVITARGVGEALTIRIERMLRQRRAERGPPLPGSRELVVMSEAKAAMEAGERFLSDAGQHVSIGDVSLLERIYAESIGLDLQVNTEAQPDRRRIT